MPMPQLDALMVNKQALPYCRETWWWRVQREERIWGLGDRWMKFTIAVVANATQWCIQSPTVDCIPSQVINSTSPANPISLFKNASKSHLFGVLLISMRWRPCKTMLPSCGQTLTAHRSHLQIESYNIISSAPLHTKCVTDVSLKTQRGNS